MASSFKEWLIETLKNVIIVRDKRILELENENRKLKEQLEENRSWYSSSDSDSGDYEDPMQWYMQSPSREDYIEKEKYIRDIKIDKDDY